MTFQTGDVALPSLRTEHIPPQVEKVSDLKIDLIDASQLCGEIADRWQILRGQSNQFASPYFDIEFTKAVARIRDDVEIVIIRNPTGEIIGFLPFQRIGEWHSEPVGGRLNDVHGIIGLKASNQLELMQHVMKSADLKSFGFHALNQVDPSWEKFVFNRLDSHFVDLSAGWPAYRQWCRSHSRTVRRQGQKTRALEREMGPIRFEFDCDDLNVLEQLIEFKRAKYQRSKTFDILSVDWAADLLREISNIDRSGFKGLLSAMYAGDELVAAHFGMVNGSVLHYWFPVFDRQFSKYSPGTELILRVAEEAPHHEINKLDFGYGDDPYKFKFCNGRESVCCGRVTFSELSFRLAKRRYEIRQRLKGIPLKPLAKKILRGMFPGFGQWNFK